VPFPCFLNPSFGCTYFVVPRLRYSPRLSQRRRLARYAQPEPNEDRRLALEVAMKPASLPVALLNRKRSSCESRSRAASCSVAWGFGFRRTGLWARPRPGALGGALVMPRKKTGPGLCFLPALKLPGVAMESRLSHEIL
jgi:hypothetical protein